MVLLIKLDLPIKIRRQEFDLANSLINDTSHELWVKNWLSISMRSMTSQNKEETMIIGVSSSGYSKNICLALELAKENNLKTLLISLKDPKIRGTYNTVILDVNEFHTSEVLTLSLFYQLIMDQVSYVLQ